MIFTLIVIFAMIGLGIWALWMMLSIPASACHDKGTLRGFLECECSDCMEPGLRGPDTTSVSND